MEYEIEQVFIKLELDTACLDSDEAVQIINREDPEKHKIKEESISENVYDDTLLQLKCEELHLNYEEDLITSIKNEEFIEDNIKCTNIPMSSKGQHSKWIETVPEENSEADPALTDKHCKRFSCKLCDKTYTEKSSLNRHFVLKHKNVSKVKTSAIHQCAKCSYKTVNVVNLNRHMKRHEPRRDNIEKYQCEHCSYSTSIKNYLTKHLLSHSKSKPQVCTACSKSFKHKRYLDCHIANIHPDNKDLIAAITSTLYKCNLCSHTFSFCINLKLHMLKHEKIPTDLEKLKCEYCEFFTYKRSNFKRHSAIHSSDEPHVCTICSKTFKHKFRLDYHISKHHSDNVSLMATITHNLLECPICSYKCFYKTNLKVHMLKHEDIPTDLEELKCEYCDFCTYKRSNLRRHLPIHSSDKPFACTICSKSFKSKRQLDSHIATNHSDNVNLMATITHNLFECQICSYKCVFKTSWKHHMVKHETISKDLEKLNCGNCDFSTYHKSHFTRHLAIHSSNEPFVCTICSKTFKRKLRLDYHIVSDHSDNVDLMSTITHTLVDCDRCSYKCFSKANMKLHMLKHKETSDLEKFNCEFCDFFTYNKSNFRRHLVRRHK